MRSSGHVRQNALATLASSVDWRAAPAAVTRGGGDVVHDDREQASNFDGIGDRQLDVACCRRRQVPSTPAFEATRAARTRELQR